MKREDLLRFMRENRYAVVSTISANGRPQSATVGVVVTDQLEVFFDTLAPSRKAVNLQTNPHIAVVLGSLEPGSTKTVQYEGIADQPTGPELATLVEQYLTKFPAGVERQSWPGITYFRVRPTWARYSDFSQIPPEICEFDKATFG